MRIVKNFADMTIRLETITALTDRLTDRQTDRLKPWLQLK